MAVPIIQIPVDDSEFKKFSDAFSAYQEKLKAMPADWQSATARVREMAEAQQKLGKMAQQTWGNAAASAAAYEKTIKSVSVAHTSMAHSVARAGHALKTMAHDAKSVAGSILSAAGWAAKMSLFGLVGGAGGLFGLDRLGASVLHGGMAARSANVKYGTMKAWNIDMMQYAPSGMLSQVAASQMTPQSLGAYAMLGLPANAQSENPAALTFQAMMAARAAYRANPSIYGATAAAQAARSLGISDNAVLNLANTPKATLNKAYAQLRVDERKFNLGTGTQSAWDSFYIQLKKAGTRIETALINALTPLTPGLKDLSIKVADFVTSLGKSAEVKKLVGDLGDGITRFSAWLGSPSFQESMKTIAYYFGQIASTFGNVAVALFGKAPGFNDVLNLKDYKTGAFRTFDTPGEGIRAGYNQILIDITRHHTATIYDLIKRWNDNGNPANDAKTPAYAAAVAHAAGLKSSSLVPIGDDVAMAKIISEMSKQEGREPVTVAQALAAIKKYGVKNTMNSVMQNIGAGAYGLPGQMVNPGVGEQIAEQARQAKIRAAQEAQGLVAKKKAPEKIAPLPAPGSPVYTPMSLQGWHRARIGQQKLITVKLSSPPGNDLAVSLNAAAPGMIWS